VSGQVSSRLAVCIPTYRRSRLLCRLLGDLAGQTLQPQTVIVVDGEPRSGEVLRALRDAALPASWRLVYVPSNHANLAYQRYLGWRAAAGADWLLYLDDDLMLRNPAALAKVLAPLVRGEREVVAVTAAITISGSNGERSLRPSGPAARLVELFGSGRGVRPGDLTPSGHRQVPVFRGREYEEVAWLRGGVMAIRMDALGPECFSDALFALTEVGCGLGEDTFLGRRLSAKGRILLAFETGIEHPNSDTPKAYPSDPYGFGRALAYSRRLLNDYYRGFDPPRLSDRVALVKSYAGNLALAWLRAVTSLRRDHCRYALGYTAGVALGLLRKPTARNLAPHIDWWGDAERALAAAVTLAPGRIP